MTTGAEPHGESTVDAGRRIAALRRLRGLSQHGLAERANMSLSLLAKVETAVKPPSPEFLAAIARALGVEEGRLTGHYRHPGDARLEQMLPAVRTALDVLDLPPDDAMRPRPLLELAADVRQVNLLAQAARYEPMIARLPGLLAELHTAAHHYTGEQQQSTWALLATTARCGHSVGIAVGHNELSVAALQRMDWAAARAGDHAPGLHAIREYLRVTAYLRARDYTACWRLNAAGTAHLDGTDSDTPGTLVARGQLHLGASIIAAHTGDLDTMHNHLELAERLAAVTGEQTERFFVGFGPTNVAVHRVMALGTAGEHAEAIRAAKGLEFPAQWLPTRIGHHYLDLARAHRWLNQPDHALDALRTARSVAPGQARRHPLARDTVSALLRTRRPSAALTDYAAWIGV